MNQLNLLPAELPWIMVSLKPEYAQAVADGSKKYEYRRGILCKVPCYALIYSSSPEKSLWIYAKFGTPILGSPEEISNIRESENAEAYNGMMEYLAGAKIASATPILEVKTFSAISLTELRQLKANFHPPQKMTYLKDGNAILEKVKVMLDTF